jgi:uncharacterized protein (TIGR02757 family)
VDLKRFLDECYACYNRREFLHTDPVSIVHEFSDRRDQEIVGLLVSCLAYGRVEMIKRSCRNLLERMEGEPFGFVSRVSESGIRSAMRGFKHRFTTDADIVRLILGVKRVLRAHETLERCFAAHLCASDETVVAALGAFVEAIGGTPEGIPHALASPARGSACKRLLLYVRWMAREDEIDVGAWRSVSPRLLIVPLDVHMARVCVSLGLTKRRQADMRTALEVTRAFSRVCPDDPTRYDFALTRLSMLRGEGAPAWVRAAVQALR